MAREKTPEEQTTDNERKQLRRYRKHLKSRMPRLKIQKLYLQLLIQRLTELEVL